MLAYKIQMLGNYPEESILSIYLTINLYVFRADLLLIIRRY